MSNYLQKEKVAELFQKFGGDAKNTGSVEGQIALFTFRITNLSEHLKINPKDNFTRRSLIKIVGQRRAMLGYLAKKDIQKYRNLIAELGIRDTLKKV